MQLKQEFTVIYHNS